MESSRNFTESEEAEVILAITKRNSNDVLICHLLTTRVKMSVYFKLLCNISMSTF